MSDAFFEALKTLDPDEKLPVEYRLYYNKDTGQPLFYSMGNEPGTYIVVDRHTYAQGNYFCVVKQGKIFDLNVTGTHRKLVPSDTGVVTHPENIMMITETGKHWALKTYEN